MLGHKNENLGFTIRRMVLAVALSLPASILLAQTASQTFVVIVPIRSEVVTPSSVSITHDLSDTPQAFPGQVWSVNSNSPAGMAVTFSVDEPFTHQGNSQAKSDAELTVQVRNTRGPGLWTTTKMTDKTSYAQSDEEAMVQVSSDGMGGANVDLQVRVLSNADSPPMGNYDTTVYCTIAIP